MPDQAVISRAKPRDLPDLVAMISKLCAFHGDPCPMGLARAHREFFTQSRLIGLIARTHCAPVGYAVLEAHWRPMSEGDGLDIAHLFVEEGWRGRGIGQRLVDAARAEARTQGAVRLTIGTAPENTAAAKAYRAMGLDEIIAPSGARFAIPLAP